MFWRLFFVVALLVPSVSNAEYNPRKLAQSLGGYLRMTANIEYLGSSQCSYLFSTKSSVDQSLRDALLHFRLSQLTMKMRSLRIPSELGKAGGRRCS